MIGLIRWGFRSAFSCRSNRTLFYLGIDQHARQITISLRDDQGDVVQARQVSTQSEKIEEFFERLRCEFLRNGEPFLAVVEVCGFNDWLLQALEEHGCHKTILIQPEERKKQKTDRRDAAALSELLWVNRERFLAGKPVHGLRQVQLPSATDQQSRRLTTLRKEAPDVVRALARHCDINLTLKYTHATPAAQADAIRKMPGLPGP